MTNYMPIYRWKTCASRIPPQRGTKVEIVKKMIEQGKMLPMKGVMGYDYAYFAYNTYITVLRFVNTKMVIMSDAPGEYFSMWEYAGRCIGGKVLLGGLGLGILTNLLSLRRDVESITVVEIEPEVIRMVKPYLNNYIPINIIEGDIFDVFPKLENEEFDSVIVDIWNDPNEEESFEDVRLMCEYLFPDAQRLYWAFQHKADLEEVIMMKIWISSFSG